MEVGDSGDPHACEGGQRYDGLDCLSLARILTIKDATTCLPIPRGCRISAELSVARTRVKHLRPWPICRATPHYESQLAAT